jgi:putative transposase
MILTNKQKDILNNWFDAYTLMYNETLKYIRNSCYLFRNNIIKKHLKDIPKKYTNFIYLRSKLLDIKKKIQQTTNNNKIHIHTLDYAIKQLVTNLKSAITNLKNGHIKRFRIKFWKLNRPSKTLDIEKENIKNNKLCYNIFGDIKYIYNNSIYELSNIKSNIKINYNSILNEYTLLIPNKNVPKKIKDKPRNIIFLDPGLRTFMTGLSEKEQFIIAPHINKLITIKLKRLYNIKSNINISNKIKKKNEKLINRKIYNMVDDLHWKVINFLILNFNNILLGNMINYKKIIFFYNLSKNKNNF